ncbi:MULTISPECIES: phage protein NinX family protein [unclassified Morganella (in: enterobacteria)]|uniref:phage protein NinX family protein n=1 Tax=unclassified Morganella (in: enterobacteria) TaxID=2676694 RepID=UPI002943B250|nr:MULTISPECIES: phage protein NinX family protein [unclassified Morganella (in: enterobacteria)]
MNKYRDKSDSEINKAVADFYLTREYRFNSADKIVELMDIDLSCEFGGEINLKDKYVTGTFDPCNDPADAMPIVIENGICMNYIDKDIGWGAYHFDEEKGELEIYDKNYYRAAMICFLIMKDEENEKV